MTQPPDAAALVADFSADNVLAAIKRLTALASAENPPAPVTKATLWAYLHGRRDADERASGLRKQLDQHSTALVNTHAALALRRPEAGPNCTCAARFYEGETPDAHQGSCATRDALEPSDKGVGR